MWVWLPASRKASTQEAGADVKTRCLPGIWGTHVSKPISLGRWETRVSKPIFISLRRQSSYKEEEGNTAKRSREGFEKFSACHRAWSIPIRPVIVRCASSRVSHPGFMSPGSTIEGQPISQS